jgi:hypothetical protein
MRGKTDYERLSVWETCKSDVISIIRIIREPMPMLGGRSPTFGWTTWNPCVCLYVYDCYLSYCELCFHIDNSNKWYQRWLCMWVVSMGEIYQWKTHFMSRERSFYFAWSWVISVGGSDVGKLFNWSRVLYYTWGLFFIISSEFATAQSNHLWYGICFLELWYVIYGMA